MVGAVVVGRSYGVATSSPEEIPGGTEFPFSLNRINVVLTSAQALALAFSSRRLRTTAEQMDLVDTG
mgnify:CR=1 FL=1